MTTLQLTSTQTQVLQHALEHNGGRINWFPDNVKGGARKKVLDALLGRELILYDGSDWLLASSGYEALGCAQPAVATMDATPALATNVVANVAPQSAPAQNTKTPSTRAHSKQATIIEMLKRAEGATLGQIIEATGWQAHTVRGTFAGAFKKKLGLSITSDKAQGQQRVYRIAA